MDFALYLTTRQCTIELNGKFTHQKDVNVLVLKIMYSYFWVSFQEIFDRG